jgi:hypothetical protein
MTKDGLSQIDCVTWLGWTLLVATVFGLVAIAVQNDRHEEAMWRRACGPGTGGFEECMERRDD